VPSRPGGRGGFRSSGWRGTGARAWPRQSRAGTCEPDETRPAGLGPIFHTALPICLQPGCRSEAPELARSDAGTRVACPNGAKKRDYGKKLARYELGPPPPPPCYDRWNMKPDPSTRSGAQGIRRTCSAPPRIFGDLFSACPGRQFADGGGRAAIAITWRRPRQAERPYPSRRAYARGRPRAAIRARHPPIGRERRDPPTWNFRLGGAIASDGVTAVR